MFLHDEFGHVAKPGFTRSVDPRAARRQFHVSMAVVAVLAVAIGGSAFAIRPASGYDTQGQRANIDAAAAVNHHPINASVRSIVTFGG